MVARKKSIAKGVERKRRLVVVAFKENKNRLIFAHALRLGLADDDGNGPKRAKKELSPEPLIKRSVLPHNTVSNRNIIQ